MHTDDKLSGQSRPYVTAYLALLLSVCLAMDVRAACRKGATGISPYEKVNWWPKEGNPHGINIKLERGLPSIWSDFGSSYGISGRRRAKTLGWINRRHLGVDIRPHPGFRLTPIIAAQDGLVSTIYYSKVGGLTVIIESPLLPLPEAYKDAPKFVQDSVRDRASVVGSYYIHLARRPLFVKKGQAVRRGQLIGIMSRTGTGAGCHVHLHFAAYIEGPQNPHLYWFSNSETGKGQPSKMAVIPAFNRNREYAVKPGQTRILSYPVPRKSDMPYYLKLVRQRSK